MDAESIGRIRENFGVIAPSADALVDLFYERLFAAHPELRKMFPPDMTQQKKHLLGAIGLVVKNADKLGTLEKPLMEMGARHVGYGAKDEHYPIVRDILLSAMRDITGPSWTLQVRADWATAINAVAEFMIRGAKQAAAVKKAA